jgi:hypothetical protein
MVLLFLLISNIGSDFGETAALAVFLFAVRRSRLMWWTAPAPGIEVP